MSQQAGLLGTGGEAPPLPEDDGFAAADALRAEEESGAATAAAMEAAGVPVTEGASVSYFGFEEIHRVYLDPTRDGSYVEHKLLNEGARRKYLNKVNRDIMLQRSTGNAIMRMQQGDEKHELLESAICGWNLVGAQGEPLVFDKNKLQKFLSEANPVVIDRIEKDIRLRNPWLLTEITVEEIDKQIAELQEMRAKKVEEDEGNGS